MKKVTRRILGFTLVELIVVVIIIGVLASIAVPQYLKAVERAKRGKAFAYLSFIRDAEQMYRAEKDTYTTSMDELRSHLESLTEDDGDWVYTIDPISASSFKVSAIRKMGANSGEFIILDQLGNMTENFTP